MNKTKISVSLSTVGFILVILKLVKVIKISWALVLLPFYFPFAAAFLLVAFISIIVTISTLLK